MNVLTKFEIKTLNIVVVCNADYAVVVKLKEHWQKNKIIYSL